MRVVKHKNARALVIIMLMISACSANFAKHSEQHFNGKDAVPSRLPYNPCKSCDLCKLSKKDLANFCRGCIGNFITKNPDVLCNLLVTENLTVGGNQCVAGNLKIQGCIDAKNLHGRQGPPGKRGKKGEVGPIGPTGDKGATGDTGITGVKGQTGDKGPSGDGGTGPRGLTGQRGATGDKGLTGDKGPTGDRGETGCPGPIGPIGPQPDPITTLFTQGPLAFMQQEQLYQTGGVVVEFPEGMFTEQPCLQSSIRAVEPMILGALYSSIIVETSISQARIVVTKMVDGVIVEAEPNEVMVVAQAVGAREVEL